jgi:hypothetical protein
MFNFFRSKTIWTAIITAVIGAGCFITGRADLVDFVQIESLAALAAFLRQGVAKAEL